MNRRALLPVAAALALVWSFVALAAGPGWTWTLPAGFPEPLVPDDNPMSAAKVELGRYLFYDARLSANETQSCASCHRQELAFTDGLRTSVGSTGELHPRNAQTLTNAAYNATLTWGNPVLTELEQQILIPIFGEFPIELGASNHEDEIYARFEADETYRRLFAAAFPERDGAVATDTIVHALASFVRTMISSDSRFDRYARGDRDALTASEVRGLDLFFSERTECSHCHVGFDFTTSVQHANNVDFIERPFHNTGLYNLGGDGAYPTGNRGAFEITGDPADMGAFRPPTLRNIALTAPYFHDGSAASLEEVVRIYEAGGRVIDDGPLAGDGRANPFKNGFVGGFELTDAERDDLVAFLESLTDETFITDPRLSDPFASDATD